MTQLKYIFQNILKGIFVEIFYLIILMARGEYFNLKKLFMN